MSAQAGAAARVYNPLRKVRDLESAVHDLANMVGVVADRIEAAFKENKTDANTYYLAQDEGGADGCSVHITRTKWPRPS